MRSPRQSMIPAPAAAPPPSRGQALDHPVLQCAKRAFDASLRLRAVGADDVDAQCQQGATELGYPVAAGSLLAVHPLNDVLHRSSSHRCSPRRSAPSPSPTLPHRISRSRGVKSRPTCPSCGRPQHAGPLPIARSTPKPCGASSQPSHRWREMDSNPRSPVCGELGAPGPRATRPRAIVKPRNADRSRRLGERFAHAWGAFHTDKAALELEIGFGDPEHLAASLFRLLGNVRDLSGRYDLSARLLPK